MKTKQGIEEKLKIYEQIKDNSGIFTSEFMTSIGAITALKWVLEDSEVENEERTKRTTKNSIFLGQLPMSEIEVVGNIYENPELLENK